MYLHPFGHVDVKVETPFLWSHEREATHFSTVMKTCAAKTPNKWNDLNQVVQKSSQLKHARCKGINL